MKYKIVWILLVTLLALTLTACSSEADELSGKIEALNQELGGLNQSIEDMNAQVAGLNEEIDILKASNEAMEAELEDVNSQILPANAITAAYEIMAFIHAEDIASFAAYVHPSAGVRFSPYQYVDLVNDQVMSAAQVNSSSTSPAILTWGVHDGSGEPIDLNFMDYFDRFIYDHNFYMAPVIGNNYVVSSGNMINNISMAYPTAEFVEFYYPQFDPQYTGMDWRSLTLVLENVSGTYYLVGIVHGEWTI